ncbi:MAG: alpha/beta hydrolase family protein, partial [Pseudomonas sp.]|nr:alpha/beta hydrolase family protein [Pseudomonas sp.]
YPLTVDQMRAGLPGLIDCIELDNVGHWVQHESPDVVNEHLVTFLRAVSPV